MNRLSNATSSYLKSAAHQPIDWYEFGEEAFEKAKADNKPILLDIGAVWCHWCHVIDRESYDDPEIAQIINDNYIAVKVDRDQRPDVDARYQHVVQSMTGHGGWPLTAILTWDGRLIYGGTYFPKHVFKNVLLQVRKAYDEKQDEIFLPHEILTDELAKNQLASEGDGVEVYPTPDDAGIHQAVSAMHRMFDPVNGGFGAAPKFPHFSALQLLITQLFHEPNPQQLTMLNATLDRMALGGVYDQLAGGFHRYSVDAEWHVPHFEKMAYDNAEAITVYAQAYRLTGNDFYKHIALDIIRWVNAQLSDQALGGFYASQDADIDLNDDGDHFTWTLDEAKAILNNEEFEFIQRHYDLTAKGDMHERPGRNVLWVKNETLNTQQEALLASTQSKMMIARMQRPIPFIDQTLYVNWNGMLTAAYFEAADLLENADARAFAEKSLARILQEFYQPGQKVLHTTGIDGVLEDYAWLSLATLKGYYSTGKQSYLDAAKDIADLILNKFEDAAEGGFFDTAETTGAIGLLKFRRKPAEDNPSSSANAIAIQVLIQLHYLTGETRYLESADRALRILLALNGGYGFFVAALNLGLFWFLNPPLKLEVVGSDSAFSAESRRAFYPGKIIAYAGEGKPEVRVCVGHTCQLPVSTAKELQQAIHNLEPVGSK